MSWSLRVVKTSAKDEDYYEIREVYFDSMGVLLGHTQATVGGESIEELREYLTWMLESLSKKVIKSEEFKEEWARK